MTDRLLHIRKRLTGGTVIPRLFFLACVACALAAFLTQTSPETVRISGPESSAVGITGICGTDLSDVQRGNMSSDGLPVQTETPLLVLPLIHKLDDSGRRGPIKYHALRVNRTVEYTACIDRPVIASIANVSSCLGRQATLVGAKPSGTG